MHRGSTGHGQPSPARHPFYSLLEVHQECNQDELKRAYRKMALVRQGRGGTCVCPCCSGQWPRVVEETYPHALGCVRHPAGAYEYGSCFLWRLALHEVGLYRERGRGFAG